MKSLLLLSAVVVAVSASAIPAQVPFEDITAFDYHQRVGVPHAELIKKTEESITSDSSRIIGGSQAGLGQYPYQSGLVISLTNGWTSVCGASLLSNTRAVTAAHCWWDGSNQAWQFQIVLGSTTLFTGGTRLNTNNVQMHASWTPNASVGRFTNDIAMITHGLVTYTNIIQPISLPSGAELNNLFVNSNAIASGFGANSDSQTGIPSNQVLWHVALRVITNAECAASYGSNDVIASTICTSGAGRVGTCGGDSGGPLALWSNGRNILIGITNFGSIWCEGGSPSAFARVSSFEPWIRARM